MNEAPPVPGTPFPYKLWVVVNPPHAATFIPVRSVLEALELAARIVREQQDDQRVFANAFGLVHYDAEYVRYNPRNSGWVEWHNEMDQEVFAGAQFADGEGEDFSYFLDLYLEDPAQFPAPGPSPLAGAVPVIAAGERAVAIGGTHVEGDVAGPVFSGRFDGPVVVTGDGNNVVR